MNDDNYQPKHGGGGYFQGDTAPNYQPRHASGLVRVTVGAHGIDRGYREDVRLLPLTGPQSPGGAW